MKSVLYKFSIALICSLLLASNGWAVEAEPSVRAGSDIYHDYCSVCHGDRGNGRSRASGGLSPSPRDFTSITSAHELTRERMIFSVSYGRPNTAMVSWKKRINQAEIEAVVDYVRNSFMNLEAQKVAELAAADSQEIEPSVSAIENLDPLDPRYLALPMPFGLEGKAEWGGMFYGMSCANCHGSKGDGKGPRSDFIFPKPRDFKHPASLQKLNRPKLFEVVNQGSHASEMPSWDKVLTYQEIAHVVEYVYQSFIEGDVK
ncbi:MAG: cytochrome c [Motiliproteus sp.]